MKVHEEFASKYLGKVGVIEDGDGAPIKIVTVRHSKYVVHPEDVPTYGCPPDTVGILVDWLPAGLEYDESGPGRPKEKGVNPDLIPDKSTWVTFPKTFADTPVYYKRGKALFPLLRC